LLNNFVLLALANFYITSGKAIVAKASHVPVNHAQPSLFSVHCETAWMEAKVP
jgi:hypothetical protein